MSSSLITYKKDEETRHHGCKYEVPHGPLENPEINTNQIDQGNSMKKIVYKHTRNGNKVATPLYARLYSVNLLGFLCSELPQQDEAKDSISF